MLFSLRLGKRRDLQAAAQNKPVLKLGAKGDGVAAVQELLRDLGHAFPRSFRTGRADGIFGAETKANVQAYQRGASLKPDGILGKLTLGRLDELIVKNDILEEHPEAVVAASERRNHMLPLKARTRIAT